MRIHLPESERTRERSPHSVAISSLVHGLIGAFAVAATTGPSRPARSSELPDDTVHIAMYEPAPPDVHVARDPENAGSRVLCECPVLAPVQVPIPDVPATLPPIIAPLGPVQSDAWRAGTTPTMGVGERRTGSDAGPFLPHQVERPPAVAGGPIPLYPEPLRRAGVTGRVVVAFVIDTTGMALMETLRVNSSDHDLFTLAVRRAIRATRFLPGEASGRKVRVLVRQEHVFTLSR
jgi:protein TonB